MATAPRKHVSAQEQARRAQQAAPSAQQHAVAHPTDPEDFSTLSPSLDLPEPTEEEMEESRRVIQAVNLDEVTDERIPFSYWHYSIVESRDPTTNEVVKERVRVPRRVRLIKDIPSDVFLEFVALNQGLPNLRKLDRAALRQVKEGCHKACQFTLPDMPFEDVDALPLDTLIALVERFFT